MASTKLDNGRAIELACKLLADRFAAITATPDAWGTITISVEIERSKATKIIPHVKGPTVRVKN
mgnify:CR=1 FL=1